MGVSPKEFERMKQRVAGGSSPARRLNVASPLVESSLQPRSASSHAVIIGVDPSLRGTGYGVIRVGKPHPVAIAHGTISCPAGWEQSRCLAKIAETLDDVVKRHHPTACAVEGIFFAQNLQTAIIMGAARGAALATLAKNGIEVYEIAARKVKQAIVGHGGAQKFAVAKMVQRMLHLEELPDPDAADALALALSYAQESGRYGLNQPKRV